MSIISANINIGDTFYIEHFPMRSMNAQAIIIHCTVTKIGHPTKVRVDTEVQKNILVDIKDLKEYE